MREDRLNLHGLSVHYYEAGLEGGNVLFIHGWGSSGRMWRGPMEHLSTRLHCLALDLPGYGYSDKPSFPWYSLPNFVSAAYEFARAVRACPAVLVGHSLGGTIALEYALRYPQEVERLVLVNAVVTGRLFLNVQWLSRRVPGRPVIGIARRLWPSAVSLLKRRLAREDQRRPIEGHARRDLEDLSLATIDSLLGSARIVRHDLSARLGDVRVPTLVIVGARDRTVPADDGRLAARSIPEARLVELAVNHQPTDEDPETFMRVLEAYLFDEIGEGQLGS